VDFEKSVAFIGREALRKQLDEGVRKRLVMFTLDDPSAFPWGGEPILMDGRNVGELTSVGYSRKHGRAIGMGYARAQPDGPPLTDEAILRARYQVDIAGDLVAVTPHMQLR
jgi:4-methylaminobutanoate oxidase (formaldehyde-forming)